MKYKIFTALTVLCLVFSSCEQKLDELNIDPNSLTEVPLALQLPEAIVQAVFNAGSNPNRIAGIVMQQLRGIDAQQADYTRYVIGEDAVNNFWNTGLYAGVLRSCDVIITQATVEEAPFYSGAAKILMANQLGIATSMFGDLPYNEAFQGADNLMPGYDSQEAIYDIVQNLLDEGMEEIATDGGGANAGYLGGDLLYDGASESWVAMARALKARYLMHTLNRNPGNAAAALTQLEDAFEEDGQPLFTFGTSVTQNWSLAKFGLDRPSTLAFHEQFAAMLSDDPRLPVYAEFDGTFWQYFGNPAFVWAKNDATVPLISYVEVKFLEAEATARTGGDDVADVLAEGIQASFNLVGMVDTVDYITNASNLDGLDDESTIERIMTESYKAYYGFNFHETWTNYRRTGYPVIMEPSEDLTSGANPSGVLPERFLYPESESQTNSTNVEAAKSRQGGALLDATLWAFE